MRREDDRVFGEFDDVNVFAAQLADDGLHAHALHSDASADAIHVAVAADHGDLGAFAGFTRAAPDYDCVVVDLRNFLFEEAHHQLRRAARDYYTCIFAGFFDALNDAAHAVAHAEVFKLALFLLGKPRFGFSEIHDQVLALNALHAAVDQLAHAAGIFREDGFTLGFAHLLQNHLLGGLGGDAPQRVGRFRKAHLGFDFHRRIDPARVLQRDFLHGIKHRVDHFLDAKNLQRAGLIVEIRDHV